MSEQVLSKSARSSAGRDGQPQSIVQPLDSTESYATMPAADIMAKLALGKIWENFRDHALGDAARALAADLRNRYMHAHQYHNGVHAQEVIAQYLMIAELAGLPQDDKSQLLRVVAAAYHDLGNGTAPGPAGVDEVASVRAFLTDWTAARNRTYRHFGAFDALSRLDACDALEVSARILGTVFRDRFCSAEHLSKQDYVREFAAELGSRAVELGFTPEVFKKFGDRYGIDVGPTGGNLALALARAMTSPEAIALKHADVSGSLSTVDNLKYHLLNAEEDARRAEPRTAENPADYAKNFVGFLTGKFHAAEDGSAMKRAIDKDPDSIFVGLNNVVAEFGRQKFAHWRESGEEIRAMFDTAPDGNLLRELHAMVNSGQSVVAIPVSELRERLRSRRFDLTHYPGLNNPKSAYEHRALAELSGDAVNDILLPDNPRRSKYSEMTFEKPAEIFAGHA